ncbi:MAG TPA: hypothetical protein VMJ52_05080 [Xanthobacteraceae bacterium]|nr:hypothetical protein [Xanthobacteraceae bacterium]
MITGKFSAAIAVLSVLTTTAFADDAAPPNDNARYTFNKVESGFVRLDTQTGAVSLCSQRTVGWACQAAPDDRAVLESEIARLRTENAALKQDILSHGLPLPPGAMAQAPLSGDNSVTLRLPDDADVSRAVAFAGRMWHRLVDAIVRAQQQFLNRS